MIFSFSILLTWFQIVSNKNTNFKFIIKLINFIREVKNRTIILIKKIVKLNHQNFFINKITLYYIFIQLNNKFREKLV